MNKRQIIASLNNIANSLDNSGLYKEATSITNLMVKLAEDFDMSANSIAEPVIEPKTKDSTVLQNVINKFEKKVDNICSNSKDAKDAMSLMSNEYYKGLIYIIDYSSPKDRPKFGNRAMEIMNECLKKYNLV